MVRASRSCFWVLSVAAVVQSAAWGQSVPLVGDATFNSTVAVAPVHRSTSVALPHLRV